MTPFCPKCGRPVPVDDVNLSTGLARCRACNNLFNIAASVPPAPAGAARTAPAATPLLPVSRRLHISEFAGVLRIHWRWFTPAYLFIAIFCVAWDSFLIFWYSMAFGSHHAPWIMKVFPIGHVAVGVGLTYTVLTGFLNATTVTAGQDSLTVRHGPLPWVGNRTLPAATIRQIHCEQRRSTNNRNYNSAVAYDLYATLSDGQRVKLLSGFTDPTEPRVIEQRIESHLRIANQPVVGEYRG
jgi:hypothetical protein